MSAIKVLPEHLANQIAAGEVIERPASVVKELLENAIDAGAKTVSIVVEGGGRRRIRVEDDGRGMAHDDLSLALQRHATSKIAREADLGAIATLGFRGEALPAIASVSRLTLQSSVEAAQGTRVEVEAGRVLRVSPAGHPCGTSVDVRDLFFNTPARAKFLRSSPTELGHISDLVASYAAVTPQVSVSLHHEGRCLLATTPARDERARIAQLQGPAWTDAIPFDSTRGPVRTRGLIAPPGLAGSTRRGQHIYVNGRLVGDRVIAHAIASACEGFLPKDRHAAVYLFIECPPAVVDVNVHPAKAEVRFRDGRGVHDLVRKAIETALRAALPLTPFEVSGHSTAAMPPMGAGDGLEAVTSCRERPAQGGFTLASSLASQTRPSGPPAWEASAAGSARPARMFTGPTALAHYRRSYILAEDEHGLLVIDQHAAHERVLFERLSARTGQGDRGRQALLFPLTVTPPRALSARLDEVVRELDTLGFTSEVFGGATIVVREVPPELKESDPVELLRDLLEQMAAGSADVPTGGLSRRDRLIATVACHAAVKVRMSLTCEKMNYLLKELFRTRTPLKCPHGRPAVLRFSHQSIERRFDRP